MYIRYIKNRGVEYGVLATSQRNGDKVDKTYVNLGRVIDKERNIFKSRERGYFVYDLTSDTYSAPPKDFIAPESKARRKTTPLGTLRFGNTFVLNALCEKYGIVDIIRNQIGVVNPDSFLALLYYYLLTKDDNEYAELWYEGDYLRYLLPNARMGSTEINALLEEAGDDYLKHRFFQAYLDLFPGLKDGGAILIDSTGLPNAEHFPLSCIATMDGTISMETKIIYVAKCESELTIFYQYNPGDIPDNILFRNLLEHLSEYGVKTDDAIVDAGYSSLENIGECFDIGIDVLSRLSPNLTQYKEAISEVGSSLEAKGNCVVQLGGMLYVVELEKELEGRKVYLYVGLDPHERSGQLIHLATSKYEEMLDAEEISRKIEDSGKFVLLSTRHLQKGEVVSFYYKRQEIEQLFDVDRNYVRSRPLRIHSMEALKGHLFFTFIGAVVLTLIYQELLGNNIHGDLPAMKERQGWKSAIKASEFNWIAMFGRLANQGCINYGKRLVPDVPTKPVNDVYKFFGIESPGHIRIERNGKLKVVGTNNPQN